MFCDFFFPFRSIFPIHPSFRIIAMAEPPVIGSATQQWLGPELLTMFFFHYMKPLVKSEEMQVVKEMVRAKAVPAQCQQLFSFFKVHGNILEQSWTCLAFPPPFISTSSHIMVQVLILKLHILKNHPEALVESHLMILFLQCLSSRSEKVT